MVELLGELRDYRRGALGPVWQLGALTLDLLRVADVESEIWDREQQRQINETVEQANG